MSATKKDLFLESQHAYQDKKYAEAVKSSTLALSSLPLSKLDTSKVLELRSSAFFKMGRSDLALDDGKAMIRLSRCDARGYLRCGAIEIYSGRTASALKFYEHGLKNTPITDPMHGQLSVKVSKAMQLLQEESFLSKKTDPTTILPFELLQMVLSYLSYTQIVGVLRVSRTWHRILGAISPLSSSLDFRQPRGKTIGAKAVIAALKRLSKSRKYIALANLDEGARKVMEKSLQNWVSWNTLEQLYIGPASVSLNAIKMKKLRIRSMEIGSHILLNTNEISSIFASCPHLESAVFARIEGDIQSHTTTAFHVPTILLNLRNLKLGTSLDEGLPVARYPGYMFSSYFPNLHTLCLHHAFISGSLILSSMPQLRNLELIYCDVDSQICLPSSLEHFTSKEHVRSNVYLSDDSEPESLARLPQLKSVHFSTTQLKTMIELLRRSQILPDQLRTVNITINNLNEWNTSQDMLLDSKDIFQGVENLEFNAQSLCDSDFEIFATCFPALQAVKLVKAGITGAFIADLLKRPGTKISRVALRDCYRVSGDVVDWAKAKGIDINVTKDTGQKRAPSRTVRYE